MKQNENQQMIEQRLETIMREEINILREILASVQEEQQAILIKHEESMQTILARKNLLVETIQYWREAMVKQLNQLTHSLPTTPICCEHEEGLVNLADLIGFDHLEVLSLRDQILALAEKIEQQTKINHTLVERKVSFSTASMQSASTPFSNSYLQAVAPKKQKVLLMTLPNPEER